jgi:serine/threonine protein kinase
VESFGQPPEAIYFGFNADGPLKSGSIGSVYLAKKPVTMNGVEQLVPVIVKIARYNLDREFLMGKTSIGLMLLSSHYWAPHGKLAPFLKAMSTQIDGFIEGFRGELQFGREAEVQARFWQHARHSSVWRVPRVYRAAERVIEMEFVEGAVNISRAVANFEPRDAVAYRRELARKFLHMVLSQVLVHREIHGDLHPGNVMVDGEGRLHVIDWGNAVELSGKLAPVLFYLRGARHDLALTDALIGGTTLRQRRRAAPKFATPGANHKGHRAVVTHVRMDDVSGRQRRLAQARQPARPSVVEHPAPGARHTRRVSASFALACRHRRHAGQSVQGRAAPAGVGRPGDCREQFSGSCRAGHDPRKAGRACRRPTEQ